MKIRCSSIVIATYLMAASIAPISATADKEAASVVVDNFPVVQDVAVVNAPAVQDVNITNTVLPVTPAPVARFQIVGVTSTTYTGRLGGPWGAAEKCDAEFPGTRMCTIEEARRSMPPFPVIPAPGAWTDPSTLSPNFTGNDHRCAQVHAPPRSHRELLIFFSDLPSCR